MSDKQIPGRWSSAYERINVGADYPIFGLMRCIEELGAAESRVRELEQALAGLMKLVDDGILVRDTSHDGETGWAMRQLPIVRVLQQAQSALHVTDKAAKNG